MCRGLRVEIATDGSFCRCRKGSPPGNCVPETMLVFCPGVWAETAREATTTKQRQTANDERMSKSPAESLFEGLQLEQGGSSDAEYTTVLGGAGPRGGHLGEKSGQIASAVKASRGAEQCKEEGKKWSG